MTRIQKDPKSAEKLAKLKKVPVDAIRKFNALIVDIPIGELSLKDSHRTIYVLSSTLVQVKEATDKLAKIFNTKEVKTKALVDKYEGKKGEVPLPTVEEILTDLKSLLVDDEEIQKHLDANTKNQE